MIIMWPVFYGLCATVNSFLCACPTQDPMVRRRGSILISTDPHAPGLASTILASLVMFAVLFPGSAPGAIQLPELSTAMSANMYGPCAFTWAKGATRLFGTVAV